MKNLGFLTDSFFLEMAKEIIQYPDYVLVRSPNQPNFYYGNYLLLNKAPKSLEKEQWEGKFKQHFTNENINHFTFCWSGDEKGGIQAFLNGGYELEELFVLTIQKEDLVELENKNNDIAIRAFKTEGDWQNWISLECKERPEGFDEANYKKYIKGRVSIYQQLNKKNCGNFYGAYLGTELVASAGLFHKEGIGRFQNVRTKTAFRKKGICQTLIHHICRIGLQNLDQLVIAAEKEYHALGIYKRLGFKETESQTSVCWRKN